ncbi:competence type IV pilus minor pilin ComGE [Anaerococcus sp. mt242]|uniref:competence type IV pilus minor pilin ComGE n=1 Tax=Anaerococcus sp. mt242 TaxID=2661917 RepID=UPI00193120DF|nr:competence type IV pilus minor pilin ComGE [Anaerococcus sp. mt242]
MKKYKGGFTLIETILALGILALIATFLLPSLQTLINSSNELKEDPQIIFALEEALEAEKSNTNPSYNSKAIYVNGYEITITRSIYNKDLDRIIVKRDKYELELLEENYEKKRLYSN